LRKVIAEASRRLAAPGAALSARLGNNQVDAALPATTRDPRSLASTRMPADAAADEPVNTG
jgi:hypothetical protein